ncbi:MAG TPA: hypothetical protein VFD13_04385 [Candidatus Kapabacteria bacterium]|nr:hypothetical protein [Candidatus Kapabacteria bacterium]
MKFVQYFLPIITHWFERIRVAIAAILDSVLECSRFVIPRAVCRLRATTLCYALVDDMTSMHEGDHRLLRIAGDDVRNACNRRWDDPSSYYNDRSSVLPYPPERRGVPILVARPRR